METPEAKVLLGALGTIFEGRILSDILAITERAHWVPAYAGTTKAVDEGLFATPSCAGTT